MAAGQKDRRCDEESQETSQVSPFTSLVVFATLNSKECDTADYGRSQRGMFSCKRDHVNLVASLYQCLGVAPNSIVAFITTMGDHADLFSGIPQRRLDFLTIESGNLVR